MYDRLFTTALALCVLPGATCAPLQPGSRAPEFAFDKGWNDAPKSFADMKGKAVMLEFFATW